MSPHREAPSAPAPVEEVLSETREKISGPSLDALEPTPHAQRAGLRQTSARIVRIEGETLVLRPDDGTDVEVRARRAVSCLVEPELDDLVLVAVGNTTQSGFVLAVLERQTPNTALSVPGDLDIRLKEGRLRVAAQKGIDLISPQTIDLVTGRVGVHANGAKVVASEIVALASQVIAELTNVQLEGTVLDKVFERVSEHVQRSIRNVDEIDQLKARQIDYAAEESMTLRSENTLVTAKDVVELDKDPVHFG